MEKVRKLHKSENAGWREIEWIFFLTQFGWRQSKFWNSDVCPFTCCHEKQAIVIAVT